MKEPKIRFKRFEGEWHLSSYNDIGKEFKYGLNAPAIPYDGKNKYLRITDIDDETRCFMQSQISSPGTDLSDAQEYLLHEGNITFARTGASTGKSYIYHQSEGTVFFAGFLIRMIVKDRIDANFIFQNSLTNSFAQYVRFVSQRSGQPGINAEELKAYALALPSTLSEQRLIASYFQSLDTLIQATSKQLASLKQIKAASLQSMFPQEGETKPRVRFKEFEGTGNWRTKQIKDIYRITRGFVLALNLVRDTINSEYLYPVYSSQTKKGGLVGYYNKFLYEDAITWTTDGANAGDVNFRKGKFYCTNVCGVLLSQKGFANECMAEIINSVTKGYVSYVGNPKLMNGVMGDIIITIPPTLQEQQKIASFFRNLDRQITLQTRRLEKLKQIKAACLDKMFV